MGRQYQAFTEDAAAALHSLWAVALAVSILALVAVLPLALAIPNLVRSDDPLAVRIGVALALLAFGLMALQIVIGSRLRLVSDPIGLDSFWDYTVSLVFWCLRFCWHIHSWSPWPRKARIAQPIPRSMGRSSRAGRAPFVDCSQCFGRV